MNRLAALLTLASLTVPALAEDDQEQIDADWHRAHYDKREVRLPMRDGVRLFTAIYTPKDKAARYPIMLKRTPYKAGPYGESEFPAKLGPSDGFSRDGFIFVHQDVRGRYLSEGHFRDLTPHIADKTSKLAVDESSDTFDTIDWLLKEVKHHNGKVGQWGISYPGFYAAAGMIDAHPALRAVSPQAPIADWFFDDFHHHGAFFLPHAFGFLSSFGQPRPEPTRESGSRFRYPTRDGYQFFLDAGPLSNLDRLYLKGQIQTWNDIVAHPNRDEFWRARDLLPHLNNVAPAVMTVGGWFDAEDLYGSLNTYQSVEGRNPNIENTLVMGPWQHGGWARSAGDRLGNIRFGGAQSVFYQEQIELPFFRHHLKGAADPGLPEAFVFETGQNVWRRFATWPPAATQSRRLYLRAGGRLDWLPDPMDGAAGGAGSDSFMSDPNLPVPFTEAITTSMTREYMTDDQRFASRRPDVLTYRTEPLQQDLTLAGPVAAELFVATSESAADWVVKLIDVFPDDAEDPDDLPADQHLSGYQMMVRSEVLRGRFRNGYATPQPFRPNQPTKVVVPLQDLLHTFKAGHRLMIQIQSTWFPLVDRNPQKYVENIYLATEADFTAARHTVHRTGEQMSHLRINVLEQD